MEENDDVVRQLAEMMTDLNKKNRPVNEKLRAEAEEEERKRQEAEEEEQRKLEESVLQKKLKEERERRERFLKAAEEKKEENEKKKSSGFSLFGKKEKKPKRTPPKEAKVVTPEMETTEPARSPALEMQNDAEPEPEPVEKKSSGMQSLADALKKSVSPKEKPAKAEKKPKKGKKAQTAAKPQKDYATVHLVHPKSDEDQIRDELFPGRYEPTGQGQSTILTKDPEPEYSEWQEKARKDRERMDRARFREMLQDTQKKEDDIVMMAVITADMNTLVLLHSLNNFLQFVEERDFNVMLSYIFVIYKHEEPQYYIQIPNDVHIQNLMGSLYDLFMKNAVVTKDMIGQIPNIGIFQSIYIH